MDTQHRLLEEMEHAERKAWDALSRYKFQMFGYWAAIWVHLNRIGRARRPNPWSATVHLARRQVSSIQRSKSLQSIEPTAQGTFPLALSNLSSSPKNSANLVASPTAHHTDA